MARIQEAAESQRSLHRRIYVDLGAARAEPETSRQLLWVHYISALYFAAVGAIEPARESVALGARLYPHDDHLLSLKRALAGGRPGAPLDVLPFLSGSAPPIAP